MVSHVILSLSKDESMIADTSSRKHQGVPLRVGLSAASPRYRSGLYATIPHAYKQKKGQATSPP